MADGHESEDHANTITSAQLETFKRAFHHCDTHCRGTVNTDDLLSRIVSAENELAQQEIDDIVHVLKRIGSNKDVSFEKFMKFMLSAEKCLANDSGDKAQRLCNVLLKYRRKSIMSSVDQDTKTHHYTHVVGHYAAGARLIGLTDKQLAKHLTLLTSNTASSPYLQPVCPIATVGDNKRKIKERKPKMTIKHSQKPRESVDVPPLYEVSPPDVKEKKDSNKCCPKLNANKKHSEQKPHHAPGIYAFLHTPLPVVKLDCKKQHLTFEDLPMIRNKVHNALDEYKKNQEAAREKKAQIYQTFTDIEGIKSSSLQLQHKRVLEAYNFVPTHVPSHIESYFRKSAKLKTWISK